MFQYNIINVNKTTIEQLIHKDKAERMSNFMYFKI